MANETSHIKVRVRSSTYKALLAAARQEGVPLATKAAELLEVGLMLEEDLQLAQVVTYRLRSSVSFLSHQEAWQ